MKNPPNAEELLLPLIRKNKPLFRPRKLPISWVTPSPLPRFTDKICKVAFDDIPWMLERKSGGMKTKFCAGLFISQRKDDLTIQCGQSTRNKLMINTVFTLISPVRLGKYFYDFVIT